LRDIQAYYGKLNIFVAVWLLALDGCTVRPPHNLERRWNENEESCSW
jgi:hypothetical protein